MKIFFLKLWIYSICLNFGIYCQVDWSNDINREKWFDNARISINKILNRKINGNIAKNVILFLGDGMGPSTVTAGRIRKGQLKNRNGEEEITNMESLENLALSKTYNIDSQTPDSAGTATAFLCGVKTRIGVIGVDGNSVDCPSTISNKAELDSILKWAQYAGKSTGILTTVRVTHATPSAAYAHVYNRNWESFDGKVFKKSIKDQGCSDIAAQLIDNNSEINVLKFDQRLFKLKNCNFFHLKIIQLIFGGGRIKFLRDNDTDYKLTEKKGDRIDNRNLIDEWQSKMLSKNIKHKFLWNLSDFQNLKPNQYDRVLGLFNYDNMDYETERFFFVYLNAEIIQNNEKKIFFVNFPKRIAKIPQEEPSINEMTEKAIELLSTNPKGFFLLVESKTLLSKLKMKRSDLHLYIKNRWQY